MNQLRAWADSLLDFFLGAPEDEPARSYTDGQRLAVIGVVVVMARTKNAFLPSSA